MAVDIVDFYVKVFMAVLGLYLLYLEHRFEFLEAVVDDILLPHVVVDAALSMLIGPYAVVAGHRLVYIDSGVGKEEELAL